MHNVISREKDFRRSQKDLEADSVLSLSGNKGSLDKNVYNKEEKEGMPLARWIFPDKGRGILVAILLYLALELYKIFQQIDIERI